MECLERALDAEYRDRPEVMRVNTIDTEYGRLMGHYQELAEAMVTLKVKPPVDFLGRVVRTGALMAAVRSATVGMAGGQAAAAPFRSGQWLFSHNGVLTGWPESAPPC